MEEIIKVRFESFEELQSSVVLSPFVEDEGRGAAVTACPTDFRDSNLTNGCRLSCLTTLNGPDTDFLDADFSAILSSIRDADSPIELVFHKPTELPSVPMVTDVDEGPVFDSESQSIEEASSNSLKENEVDDSKDQVFENKQAPVESSLNNSNVPSVQQSLFSWTSRVRKSAADAAQQAAAIASSARERANNSRESEDEMPPESDLAKLFIQSSSGAYLPLNAQTKSSEALITNTSLVTVRQSAATPCPPGSYTYQWYKAKKGSSFWIPLEGATFATLQPSAVDVGYRLRCVVTIPTDDDSDLSDDENSVDVGTRVICQTTDSVTAAVAMFNGTQTALSRGSLFGGITGRGNADGRSFRLKLEKKSQSDADDCQPVGGAAVTIYQVVGDVAEPIHDELQPIHYISADTSYACGKDLDIVFQQGIPECATMVDALSTDGKFQCSFPNRLGRESLLLAIGIANYGGKPSDLTVDLPLFSLSESTSSCNLSVQDELSGSECDSTAEKSAEVGPNDGVQEEQDAMLPQAISLERVPSMDSRQIDVLSHSQAETDGSMDLERQVQMLRAKLTRREKTISDLQRHAARTDAQLSKSEDTVARLENQVEELKGKRNQLQKSLCQVEKRLETHEDTAKRVQGDHRKHIEKFEREIESRSEVVSNLEKSVKTLENERALLSAAVEARETKLSKMEELQSSHDKLSEKVTQQQALVASLEDSESKRVTMSQRIKDLEHELASANTSLQSASDRENKLEAQLKDADVSQKSFRAEFEAQQIAIQKLKAERNSYKQKGDSLAKEMSKVCRNGRTVRDVEKILSDDAARRQEVALLRKQKQSALEELEKARIACEQSRAAQQMAGVDQDQARILERNSELERVLSELTEYVSAKEMQLETFKQVNATLQEEIGKLSKAALSRNLAENDV